MSEESDREFPTSVLTDRQRAFLRGEVTDITPRAERSARSRIRERLQAAFHDMGLVSKHLSDEDVDQIRGRLTTSDYDNLDNFSNRIADTPIPETENLTIHYREESEEWVLRARGDRDE